MLAALTRLIVIAILVVTGLLFGPSTRTAAATCTSSVGPGIPPPSQIPAGIPGFHAAWYGQSGYPTLCPGEKATSVVAYYNSGSLGWVQGRMGQAAYLGTWNWIPGQDKPSKLGGDGTNGTPNTGWPRYNRIAAQPAAYVGPGQVAWFTFTIQAPAVPGVYKLYLRPLVEGATWMEDYGVFWVVTVLNPDGSQPPPPPPDPPVGCREWPMELSTQLNKLTLPRTLCLLQYESVPGQCLKAQGCYLYPQGKVWVRNQVDFFTIEVAVTAHENCHAHQGELFFRAGSPSGGWPMMTEGLEFKTAFDTFRSQYPDAATKWGTLGTYYEDFAEVCAAWYYGTFRATHGLRVADYPPLLQFAQKWLPK